MKARPLLLQGSVVQIQGLRLEVWILPSLLLDHAILKFVDVESDSELVLEVRQARKVIGDSTWLEALSKVNQHLELEVVEDGNA